MTGPIDCHAHVFTTDLEMADDARYRPREDAPIARYLALLDAQGIAGAVLVQPSFLGTDNGYLLAAVATAPERLRAVAVVDPMIATGALDRLEGAGVVAIRLNLIGRAVPALAEPPYHALIERLGWRGWHVEVLAEGAQWQEILPPLAHAGVRIVVDHFGRPRGPDCPGFRTILAASRDADLWVKLSGYSGAGARDCTRALLETVGPQRLVWGSDWPWTQQAEPRDYAAVRAELDDWLPDPALRQAVLADNPARLYGFDRRPGAWTALV